MKNFKNAKVSDFMDILKDSEWSEFIDNRFDSKNDFVLGTGLALTLESVRKDVYLKQNKDIN